VSDFARLKTLLKEPVIFDGRNLMSGADGTNGSVLTSLSTRTPAKGVGAGRRTQSRENS